MKLVVETAIAPTRFTIFPNLGILRPTRIIARHTAVRKMHLLSDNLPVKVNQESRMNERKKERKGR